MSYAFRCEMCEGKPPPAKSAVWKIVRHGDALVTWACDLHLAKVLRRLTDLRKSCDFTVLKLRRG